MEGGLSHVEELYEALTIGEVDIEYVSNDSTVYKILKILIILLQVLTSFRVL